MTNGARALLVTLSIGCGAPEVVREAASDIESEAQLPRRELPAVRTAGCYSESVARSDVTLSVRAEQRSFRQGERIPLVLSFASGAPDTYQLDAATYDRSGRLTLDRFEVSREGTVDPLADYFGRMMGMVLGGLRSMPMLGAEPVEVERDLNEHVRFDAPGVYVVQVSSDRVRSADGEVECVAAPIELTITAADDAADALAVETARRTLDADGATEEAQVEAARVLRYSLSPRAVAPAIEHLAHSSRPTVAFFLEFGLYGSPHRAEAVAQMERRLVDPRTPIPARFLDALVALGHWLEVPALPSRPDDDEDAAAAWDARAAEQRQARRRREDALAARLADALADKSAEARPITLATLMEIALRGRERPAWWSRLPAGPAQSLPTLPAEAQVRMLRSEWSSIASEAIVPALVTIADRIDPQDGGARVLAIRRLIELRPAEGRARVEAAIRRGEIDLGYSAADALLALPADAFGAALDEPLMAAVERRDHQLDLRVAVLARYASPAIAPRVRAVLEAQRDPMSSEAVGRLWSYLLRVDARRSARGIAASVRAAAEGYPRRRAAAALAEMAKTAWDPALEAVTIELLASEDTEVVRGAAATLRRRGGDLAERALLERLRALLAPWRGRAGELESDVLRRGDPATEARGLRYALLDALTRAHDRIPSRTTLEGMHAACVTDECRTTVSDVRRTVEDRPVRLYLTLHTSGDVDARFASRWDLSSRTERVGDGAIGARAFVIEGQPPRPEGAPRHRAEAIEWLLDHVRRLPRGTEVTLGMWPEEGVEHDALAQSLRGWLEAHGYRVVAAP